MIVVEGPKKVLIGGWAELIEAGREVAWAERYVKHQTDLAWVLGNYVCADTPNYNGHVFPLEDLVEAHKVIANKPLNLLHRPQQIVGNFVGAELLYPMRAADAAPAEAASAPAIPYVEAVAAFYRYYFPETYQAVKAAHGEGSLFFSMEAVPKSLTCLGNGDGSAGCNREFDYMGRQHASYCFVPGQLVSMADGTHKKIEDVRLGDVVLTHDGTGTVSFLHRRHYSGPITRLWKVGSSEPLIATSGHGILAIQRARLDRRTPLWLAVRQAQNWQRTEAGAISEGDLLMSTYAGDAKGFQIDLLDVFPQLTEVQPGRVAFVSGRGRPPSNTLPRLLTPSEALATLAGYYLAEGSACVPGIFGPKVTIFSLNDDEDEYAQNIQLALDKLDAGTLHGYRVKGRKSVSYRVHNTPLANLLAKLCGRGSRNKAVDPLFMLAPKNFQTEMLRRYAEGDGYLTSGHHIVYRTSSAVLGMQLVQLATRVHGIVPCIRHDERTPRGPGNRNRKVDSWKVDVAPISMKGRWMLDDNYYASKVKRVEHDEYEGPVFNLEVLPQHTYAVGDTVVFNCDHLNAPGAHKRMNKPLFTAGALVIPPGRPGWKDADVTEMSHLLQDSVDADVELEVAYSQIAEEFPHLNPREWETMMGRVLRAANGEPADVQAVDVRLTQVATQAATRAGV